MPRSRWFLVLVVVASRAAAQPPKPPVAPAVPAGYPTLTTPANLAATPGVPVEHTLTGTNLSLATHVSVSSWRGTASIVERSLDGKTLKVKFAPLKGLPPALCALRVATEAGVSNARPFLVDPLPTVAEKAGNNAKETPQDVAVSCGVTGTSETETADFFRFKVAAGQTLTFEALARRIGSPLDPVLILRDAAGAPLPGVWADDTPGLQADARITHTFKTAGEYLVEIRDSTYRGGADFAYRLRIGDFPGATCAFPLAAASANGRFGFAGPGTDGLAEQSVPVSWPGGGQNVVPVGKSGLLGWPVPVRASDHPEGVEQEPNDTPAQANTVPVPGGVSARFATKNDVDYFKFAGKKGKKVAVRALSYELGLPTEVSVRLLDAKGGELMKSNPQSAGVRLEYTPAADGDLFLACEHGNFAHGPNEVYHLSVTPVVGDFAVTLGLDRTDLPVGGVGLLPVVGVTRADGFAGPIELAFRGLKDERHPLTIPPGAAPTPAAPLWLPVHDPGFAQPGMFLGVVTATATIDGTDVTRYATVAPDVAKAALANLPVVPVEWQREIAVAVTPAAPFTLEVTLAKAEVNPGATVKGTIKATRRKEFDGEIALSTISAPASVTAKLNPIPKGKSEAEAEFTVPAGTPTGPGTIILRGTTKVMGKDVVVNAMPAVVNVKK